MKSVYYLLVVILIVGCGEAYPKENKVLHEIEKVAVPNYYRKILGYDSLQMIFFMGKWDVNFCNPNEWEFEKFKKLEMKADSIVLKYDSVMVIHYTNSEIK